MKLYNKNGRLSYYELRCGYIESKKSNIMCVQLYCENNIYFVDLFGLNRYSPKYIYYKSFDQLNEARRVYNKLATMVKNEDYSKLEKIK